MGDGKQVAKQFVTVLVTLSIGAAGALAVEHCIVNGDETVIDDAKEPVLSYREYANGTYRSYHVISSADTVITASDGSAFLIDGKAYKEYSLSGNVTVQMTFLSGSVPVIKR